MNGHRHQPTRQLLMCCLVVAVFMAILFEASAQKQPLGENETDKTMYRAYYEPPNFDQVKMELSGDEAMNVQNAVLIKGAKISSYSVAGGPPQLIAETPTCILDTTVSPWQVNSTNILRARSGDGNFYVEGVGFLWQNASSRLELSNRVYTILRQTNGAGNNASAAPVETHVHSDRATFETKSGVVIYRDNVLLTNPRLRLSCVLLTVRMAQGGTNNQLDRIVAETNVVMDFVDESGRKIYVTSDMAVYVKTIESETNELLTLTGHPRLETSNGWATADKFVLNQTTGKIHGTGNSHFHSRTALVSADTDPKAAKKNSMTEITSKDFDYDRKTGVVVFRDNVHADNPEIKLTSELLTVKLAPGDANGAAPEGFVAERHVTIDATDERGEKTHATAEKAVYSTTLANGVTNKVLELTGSPILKRVNGLIMADVLTIDQQNGIIRGKGNQHTVLVRQLATGKGSPTTADTEIFSDNMEFARATGLAVYRRDVRVLDPEMNLQAQQVMIKLPENSGATGQPGRPERMVAETNVVVDYFKEKGEKTHATGEKLVFTHSVANGTTTNEVMELTGHPAIDMTNAKGEKTHAVGDKMVYTSAISVDKPIQLVTISGHPQVTNANGVVKAEEEIIYDRVTGLTHLSKQSHIVIDIPVTPLKTNQAPATTSSAH